MSQNTIKTWQERITAAKEVDPKFNFDAVKAESIGAEIRELRARVSELEAIAVNLTDAAEATHTAVPAALTPDVIESLWNSLDGKAVIAGEQQLHWNRALRVAFAKAIEQHLLAAGQGKDSERYRHQEIGKAIERACKELPDGFEVEVMLERGAGTVTLYCPEGYGTDEGHDADTFDEQINHAIDAAMKAGAQGGGNV